MLSTAELEHTIVEQGGNKPVIVDRETVEKLCPRCEREMHPCRIRAGKASLDSGAHHCYGDGVWFDGGRIEKLFERVGHNVFGAGHARGTATMLGGALGNIVAGIGGNIGGVGAHGLGAAMAAVTEAFRPTGGGNEILRWWDKPRPRVHVPFASALAGQTLACPECSSTLRQKASVWACDDGHGVFIEPPALEAMVFEMTHASWQLPAATTAVGKGHCPACRKAMTAQPLEGVAIERCADHGVWFHAGELERVLHHSGQPAHGWLGRLFHRR